MTSPATSSSAREYSYTAVTTTLTGGGWMRAETRQAHLHRVGFRCAFCSCSIKGKKQAHMAHMTPRCRGGKNGPDNVLALCKSCNELMGQRTLQELAAVRRNGAELLARAERLLAQPLDRAAGRRLAEANKAARASKKQKRAA